MQILVFESAHKQAHVAARAAGCLQTLVQDDVDIDGSGAGESESASGSVYYVHDGLDSVDEDAIKQLQLLDSEMCKTLNNAVAMAAAAFAGARETRSKFEAYEILIASDSMARSGTSRATVWARCKVPADGVVAVIAAVCAIKFLF